MQEEEQQQEKTHKDTSQVFCDQGQKQIVAPQK